MAELPTIQYTLPGGTELAVFPIAERMSVTRPIASNIVRLMGNAYEARYEPEVLPAGTIAEHLFDPWNEQHVDRQLKTMRSHISDNGSVYWLARLTKNADDEPLYHLPYVGVAKTTPSRRPGVGRLPKTLQRSLSDTWARPNLFFNDIAVDPDWQSGHEALLPENRPHIGATLAYTALRTEVNRGRTGRLITDLTRGSGLTPISKALGLEPEQQYVPPLVVGNAQLEYQRYATAPELSLDAIRIRLQTKYRHLQRAREV